MNQSLGAISNKSSRRVKAIWIGFDGMEHCYMEVESGHRRPQQTYNTHVWRIRYSDTDALVGDYVGPSAILEVQPEGGLRVSLWAGTTPEPQAEWGRYCKRSDALGIEIWSYDCVDARAVRMAEHIVHRMLEASPPDLVGRLVEGGARVAIIGRNQFTTDIPEHSFLKWSEGGRDTDSTTRGLGGTRECPTTSCGEENLLMEEDSRYPSENILVHEFGHAVMNIGLTQEEREAVRTLYDKAYKSGLYDLAAYIMENEDEYWAEGTQAWFDATIRTDVTSGLITREMLRMRDPGLAGLMTRAYGDGSWRYTHDSPRPFRHRASSYPKDTGMSADSLGAGTADSTAALPVTAAVVEAEGRSDGPRTAGGVAPLSAPGVEESMERARLDTSGPSANGPGWLGGGRCRG